MSKAARVGDSTSGTCNFGCDECPHGRSGTNSQGSENVFINGKSAHRLGDSISISCPHGGSGQSTGGSSSVFINGKSATRVGDETTCLVCGESGNHSSGSENVYIGG